MVRRQWTRTDDKYFEEALVQFPEDFPNRFENIANNLKMPFEDVIYYYDALIHDIDLIESGQVDTMKYENYSGGISSQTKHIEKDRKRGIPWNELEHRLFLKGLKICGKGDWRSISRIVLTRTPTQVASHAQKYFLRQNSENKTKKRSSIHDIISVDHAVNNVSVTQSKFDSTMGQPDNCQQMSPNSHHSVDDFLDL